MTKSFCLVFNSHSSWRTSLTPTHRSHQVPGFLAKLEQQTLGKTSAKLNFKQLWFRQAMRLVEFPASLLGLGSGSVKWTIANTSNPLFSPFQAVKTHRSTGGGKDPFSFTSYPRLPKVRHLFKQTPVMLRCQDLPYSWCSKRRARHKPLVLELHSCGTHFETNLYNLPHHST